jgi:hypothetical protein
MDRSAAMGGIQPVDTKIFHLFWLLHSVMSRVGQGNFPSQPLKEPYVSLSTHTAPIVQPPVETPPANEQTNAADDAQSAPASESLCGSRISTSCTSASPTS